MSGRHYLSQGTIQRGPGRPPRPVQCKECDGSWQQRPLRSAGTAAADRGQDGGDLPGRGRPRPGKHSQGFPSTAPERRGAPVRGFTRISDAPIRLHCSIAEPDYVIVLDPTLLDSTSAGVPDGASADTVFLINTVESPANIRKRLGIKGGKVHTVDASLIAQESFGRPIPTCR
ncbi:MAG: 2-oxoacid:acceptor oxidoreductase family protein [bacterium]|nr:2-oxoacid:acceptor oxidoreductase family protein [bacterium]